MAYIRETEAEKENPRASLNTSIDAKVLTGFKAYCKECGFPMNIVIETFMKQFQSGEFEIQLKKNNTIEIEESEN